MCQSQANGGRRCDGANGSYYSASTLETALVNNDDTVSNPTNAEQAFHYIALAAQGKNVEPHLEEAASFDMPTSKKQLWETWSTLAQSQYPSKGLQTLYALGHEYRYPELAAIRGVPQSFIWHPEGSVEIHSQMAADVAAKIAQEQGFDEHETQLVVFGAMCHDFGKSTHTVFEESTGLYHSAGHAEAGIEKAQSFLASIGANDELQEQVSAIVGTHMHHINQPTKQSTRRLQRKLHQSHVDLKYWGVVADADVGGRAEASIPPISPNWLALASPHVPLTRAQERSLVNGDLLRSIGYEPGPQYRELIAAGAQALEEDLFYDEAGAKEWFLHNYAL